MKALVYAGWEINLSEEFDSPVEVYIDNQYYHDTRAVKILGLCEPPEIMNTMVDYAINNHNKYDYILTCNERVLSQCPNARLFLFGTTWIQSDYDILKEKEYSVSTIVGFKSMTYGHKMRHELWKQQNRITSIPRKFFTSQHGGPQGNLVLRDSKYPLFDSQFHIVLENSNLKNLFSEKVLDCFRSKTIPIYFGCPNLGDFFDSRGFFMANSVDQVIEICNSLNDSVYSNAKEYVESNYVKAAEYINFGKRLGEKVKSIISTNP
jgi:hypothetical protein